MYSKGALSPGHNCFCSQLGGAELVMSVNAKLSKVISYLKTSR